MILRFRESSKENGSRVILNLSRAQRLSLNFQRARRERRRRAHEEILTLNFTGGIQTYSTAFNYANISCVA